jgi:phosphoglucomutase
MDWKITASKWTSFTNFDRELVELQKSEKALEDSFRVWNWGYAWRNRPRTNRMNIYTTRRAAEGLAQYIVEQGEEAKDRGVAIAYDSRHKSPEFALEVAKTVGKHGIKAYLMSYDQLLCSLLPFVF